MSSEGLFAGEFGRGDAAAVASGGWLQAMLDAEAALARACARADLVPPQSAEAIAAACDPARYDPAALGAAATATGNPVIPLVQALREAVGPEHAAHVHHGATSQDILDSAAMLVAARALTGIRADAQAAAECCRRAAIEHARTPQVGRTLLQQALPRTFGLTAAEWMTGIEQALGSLSEAEPAAQLGGPVGTRAAFGDHGQQVLEDFARELGLAAPTLAWHTNRVRVAKLSGALGQLGGALGKIGLDVTLLAQDEIGELREGGGPGAGGSSSMAHKRNPVAAVTLVACARRLPGLVATMHTAMLQEHQRAAGAWQAEWETWPELLRLVGSAAAWGRALLDGLEVDAERMRANLRAAAERHGFAADDGIDAAARLAASAAGSR